MSGNRFEDPVDLVQNLLVPETQHSIALAFEIFRPTLAGPLLLRLTVLGAVKLDHEPRLKGEEVRDVRTNRMLALKFTPFG